MERIVLEVKMFFGNVEKRTWLFLAFVLVMATEFVFAGGGGAAGISAAEREILSYVRPIGQLMMAIGAVIGIVGAIRVYIKWNNGDQDVQKHLMGWLGAMIFLVVSGAVISAFFGVSM